MTDDDAMTVWLRGDGIDLAADIAGAADAPPVLFMHGGGQTRQSWGGALERVAAAGYRAVSIDLRGHGESDRAADGDYALDRFAADARAVSVGLGALPVLVGASLGGLAGLLVAGESEGLCRGLVLVDVTPRIEPEGRVEISRFMASAPDGFASLEEAARAVAAYLPHRPRPRTTTGLARNLRLGADGRYRWHWDPAFMAAGRSPDPDADRVRLDAAARAVTVPTLLLRGGRSRVVSAEGVREFLAVLPQAEFIDIEDADHMVAGDANDAFNDATLDFFARLPAPRD